MDDTSSIPASYIAPCSLIANRSPIVNLLTVFVQMERLTPCPLVLHNICAHVLKRVFIRAGRNIVTLALAQRAPFIWISDGGTLGGHKVGVRGVERGGRQRRRGRIAWWFRGAESRRTRAVGGDGEAAEAFDDDVLAAP